MDWPKDHERLLLASAGRDSFRAFAKYIYGISAHPKGGWFDDTVHGPLCDWFDAQARDWLAHRAEVREKRAEPKRKFLAILIPRGCGKSVLITRAAMLWLHLQDPDLATYIGAATRDLAAEFLSTIKLILEGKDGVSLWSWLYGNWSQGSKKWLKDEMIHGARLHGRAEPSFGVWSANSGITGRHPDVLCMDDLVTTEAIANDTDWINHAYQHLTSLIPVVERDGLVLLVGTRYADNDPFGRSFTQEGISSIAGHVDDPDYQTKSNGVWNVFYLSGRDRAGRPAIPTCWTDSAMADLQKRDPVFYALQVLNRARAPELIVLSESAFDSHVVDDVPKDLLITIHFDKALNISERIRTDSDNGMIFSGHSRSVPGMVYVLEANVSNAWTANDLARVLTTGFRKWHSLGYQIVAIADEMEPGGNAGVFQSFLYNYFVDEGLGTYWPDYHTFNRLKGQNKDERIARSIDFVAKGLVKFRRDCAALPVLRYQLCNHPFSAKKDLADAFADSFHKDIYTTKIPQLLTKGDNPKDFLGAYEDRLKGQSWWMDNDMVEFDRKPIGALRQGASPRR